MDMRKKWSCLYYASKWLCRRPYKWQFTALVFANGFCKNRDAHVIYLRFDWTVFIYSIFTSKLIVTYAHLYGWRKLKHKIHIISYELNVQGQVFGFHYAYSNIFTVTPFSKTRFLHRCKSRIYRMWCVSLYSASTSLLFLGSPSFYICFSDHEIVERTQRTYRSSCKIMLNSNLFKNLTTSARRSLKLMARWMRIRIFVGIQMKVWMINLFLKRIPQLEG